MTSTKKPNQVDNMVPTNHFRWKAKYFNLGRDGMKLDRTLQQLFLPQGSRYSDNPEGEWRNVEVVFED